MTSLFPIIIDASVLTENGSEARFTIAGEPVAIGRNEQVTGNGVWIGCDHAGYVTITPDNTVGDALFQNRPHDAISNRRISSTTP